MRRSSARLPALVVGLLVVASFAVAGPPGDQPVDPPVDQLVDPPVDSPVDPPADPMAELRRLGRTLQSRPGWTAPYRQVYVAAGMSGGDEVAGNVWLAWPSRALFVSGQPPQRQMGLDGRRVRLVDLEVGACDEHLLDDAEWARLPLAVVLDPSAAVESFSVLPTAGAGFALVPRVEGGVARVEVTLGSDGLPTEVVVLDLAGSSNRLILGAWKPAAGSPADGFLPAPPAGVECTTDLE